MSETVGRSALDIHEPLGPFTANEQLTFIDLRVVLFTISAGSLRIAVVKGDSSGVRLPRRRPTRGESLDAGASQIIEQKLRLNPRYLEQLYTVSAYESEEWTVVVSFMALIGATDVESALPHGEWRPFGDPGISSPIDRSVVDYAVTRLRAKLSYTTIGFHLLPAQFTLGELQSTYEIILGQQLDKRNFRRRMLATDVLDPTHDKRRDGSHRPAVLYTFRPPHDAERFLTPSWVESSTI